MSSISPNSTPYLPPSTSPSDPLSPPNSPLSASNSPLSLRYDAPSAIPGGMDDEIERKHASLGMGVTEDNKSLPPVSEALSLEGVTEEDKRRVLRKLDFTLIPLTMAAYTLQYIDRSAMSYAAVFTFRKDLHLTPSQYSWLGSSYFLGYLFFEFPGAYLLQRLPLSRTMGCTILAWGALLMCMAAPRNFAGMAALRTLLGASESLVTPGFVLLVSRFYARAEQPLRVGLWYCCNGLGSFTGALISYAMGHVRVKGVPPWAWIFILNGMITLIFGVVFLRVCPESPETWSKFSECERRAAVERVRGNKASLHCRQWKWHQCLEALLPWRDPAPWWYVLIVLTITIPNGGIANFLHLILQSYGYSAFQTILWGLPQAVMQVVFPLSAAYLARKLPNARCYVMVAYMMPSICGMVIQYRTRNSSALLFGYYITGSYVASLGLCFAAPGANIAGYTKRVTAGGMIFVAYATGNICGPHLFHSDEVPPYRTGMLASIVCFVLVVPMVLGLRVYYVRENARRDRVRVQAVDAYSPSRERQDVERGGGEGGGEGGVTEALSSSGDFADWTDCENPAFRYAL